MRKPSVTRTARKLHRLAYELEEDAARLREAGRDAEANGVKAASSQLGTIARMLGD